MEIKVGVKYKHYKKGTVYTVVGLVHHTETSETLVLYKPEVEPDDLKDQYPDGVTFARPLSMFTETISFDGREVLRFLPLG